MELSKLNFQVNVTPEQLSLGTFAQGRTQRLPGLGHVLPPDLELRVEKPDFGEREPLVRDQLQASTVHLTGALEILSL